MALPAILGLYVLGLFLLFAELFVPGGLLGIIGLFTVGYSIYESFVSLSTPWLGVGMIVFAVVAVPVVAWRFLRSHLLQSQQDVEEYVAADSSLSELVGKTGTAVTVLRPAGKGIVEGRRIDVVSQNRFIEAECPIEVVEVQGMRVVVREAKDR
ncbi:MAG: NfeD family protein [Planctomycetota bacterium]|jgi:membrane-bound serine protease (ClpP class)|nr:NfeD family protein [Planctomycetota bacterium]